MFFRLTSIQSAIFIVLTYLPIVIDFTAHSQHGGTNKAVSVRRGLRHLPRPCDLYFTCKTKKTLMKFIQDRNICYSNNNTFTGISEEFAEKLGIVLIVGWRWSQR